MRQPGQTNDTCVDGLRPGVRLARGVMRGLESRGFASLPEFALPDGLRMDVCALGRDGEIWCVEVKSCRADFTSDAKWQGYRAWCDCFAFAVPQGFPEQLLPADVGLFRTDEHDAELLRSPTKQMLAPARRKALTLRFARLAADRLARSTLL